MVIRPKIFKGIKIVETPLLLFLNPDFLKKYIHAEQQLDTLSN